MRDDWSEAREAKRDAVSSDDRLNVQLASGTSFRSVDSRLAAISWARRIAGSIATIYLDTETTGFGRSAEIVDIAIVDGTGAPLLDTLVKPQGSIPPDATEIHGIGDADVAGAPAWTDIHELVADVLRDRDVVIYNADFDARMIMQCGQRIGRGIPVRSWQCAMRGYAAFRGIPGRRHGEYRLHKLESAVSFFGGDPGGHRALGDAHACRHVTLGMATVPLAGHELPRPS